jgi:hypothetical protein
VHRIVNHNACPTRKLAHKRVLADPVKTIATAAIRMYIRRLARASACVPVCAPQVHGTSGTNQRATPRQKSAQNVSDPNRKQHTLVAAELQPFSFRSTRRSWPQQRQRPIAAAACLLLLQPSGQISGSQLIDRPAGEPTASRLLTTFLLDDVARDGRNINLADYVRRASGRD